ncbi:MAG: type II toxin-antitoxin system PemK/MazF family toxin [Roseburia sp.]|nr:type II toxin-antitoxin system PemK/MazF family toxin [Roseburia sp.]
MRKGDIYMADLGEDEGSLQAGMRPVIIVSNDAANKYSPVITIIPMTTKRKKKLPTHVYIQDCGLPMPSLALAEQITSINKSHFIRKMGSIQQTVYEEQVTAAIKVQLSM